jgi:GH15 family glucan-1,4-alpha-glucosidase
MADENDVSRDGYTPIEDYGAIGNLRTVALVSRGGSIDWCCFPQLDSGSVFAAILDHRKGGRFRVAPAEGSGRGNQRYVERTNVLETFWDTPGGRLTVTDLMPIRGSIVGTCDPPSAPCIFRLIRAEGAPCDVVVEWSPRFDYARAETRIEQAADGAVATAGDDRLSLQGLRGDMSVTEGDDGKPVLRARFTLSDGETVPLLLRHGSDAPGWSLDEWRQAHDQTCAAWLAWAESHDEGVAREFAGEWQPLLERSGLALKLLTYPLTGAIAAAATASLPEEIGGVRNWDYRYTWIRDASFTAQALVAIGHRQEAIDFLDWAERVSMQQENGDPELKLMYTLDGVSDIPEHELDHLEGYRCSQPVRIGNKASGQFQLDIYGELLDAAWELARLGVEPGEREWRFLTKVADAACRRWQEPDYGIWEVRSEPQHFVYSKLMVWVALDRALRLAEKFDLSGDLDRWRGTREAVRESILENGYDEERGSFVQAYGTTALDAANLLIPSVGFLPFDDPRVQGTIDASLEELTENGLVYRYRTEATGDGIEGSEGAFGLTTFWMIDALAMSGRLDEAREMFDGVARRANHVGLYSEEFDPDSGAFLGNFPQAFTHIGFINSAVYIAHAEGREVPSPAPIGSEEERREARRSEEHDGAGAVGSA